MNRQEYQKRLATAIRLLGEEAGHRYMEQRLKEMRGEVERRLRREVLDRLEGCTSVLPVGLIIDIGPGGVKIRTQRRTGAKGGEW